MKVKDFFYNLLEYFVMTVLSVIALPFLVLFLLYRIMIFPFDYYRFKRSPYQRDYPTKYSILGALHNDAAPYTVIKENGLPVEYIKVGEEEDYFHGGFFVYRDVLLSFDEPFDFDMEKEKWFCWWGECDDTDGSEAGKIEIGADLDRAGTTATVEKTKREFLDKLKQAAPEKECTRVVFFYDRKKVLRSAKTEGLKKMLELEDFVVYDKKELGKAIKGIL